MGSLVPLDSGWVLAASHISNMVQLSIQPDILSYSMVLAACRSQLRWQLCLLCTKDLQLRFSQKFLTALYNGAMVTCAESGQQQRVFELFVHMKMFDVELDIISANTCISACEKRKEWPWALQVLEVMSSELLPGDSAT